MVHHFFYQHAVLLLLGSACLLLQAVAVEAQANTPTAAESPAESDGCFSTEPSEASCGWTGSCSVDGCEEVCVPQFPKAVADDLGSLWQIQDMRALKCEVFADMVLRAVDSSTGDASRKLHMKSSAARRALEIKHTPKFETPGMPGYGRSPWVPRDMPDSPQDTTNHMIPMLLPTGLSSRTLAQQQMELRQQGCPAAAQIDEAASKLKYDADVAAGWMKLYLTEEEMSSPGALMHLANHKIMHDTDSLKKMMEDECTSATVTTQPLLDTYYGMQLDAAERWAGGASVAPGSAPQSLKACRPVDESDTMHLTRISLMYVACAEARINVDRGSCMKEAVAGHFHTPCSQAWWTLTGSNVTQTLAFQDSINSIRDHCVALTTQEACEGASLEDEEQKVRDMMQELANTTLQALAPSPPSNLSVSEPSAAVGGAAGLLQPLALTVLIAALLS